MADLKESKRQALLGDAKARASLMEFVQSLTREDNAKNPFVARSELRFRMRSIRGRVENALPAIERHAAAQERERLAQLSMDECPCGPCASARFVANIP